MKPSPPIRGWVLAILALGAGGALPAFAQTPAGTVIANQAGVSYADMGGGAYVARSEAVQTPVSGKALLGIEVSADRSPAAPGDTVLLEISLYNPGNVATQGVTLQGTLQDSLVRVLEHRSQWHSGPAGLERAFYTGTWQSSSAVGPGPRAGKRAPFGRILLPGDRQG